MTSIRLKHFFHRYSLAVFFSLFVHYSSASNTPEFNFTKSTPIGSWSSRELLATDARGKTEITVTTMKLLSSENLGGETFYWIESEMQKYREKKKNKQRKKSGHPVIIKMLVNSKIFDEEPFNIMNDLSKHAKSLIFKKGKTPPMEVSGAGAFAQMVVQSLGLSYTFELSPQGITRYEVPAGNLSCNLYNGTGMAVSKSKLKSAGVESNMESCFSDDIPFGTVYSNMTMKVLGDSSSHVTQLLEYGKSGAVSAITEEPVSMPAMMMGQ